MANDMNKQIQEETYTGVVPALPGDRMYNLPDITLTAAGFGVASWCYVQGGWLASALPFKLALIVAVIPMILVGLIMMYCVVIPTRHGIDLWIYQRAVFGYRFCAILCMVSILTNWGWYAVNCNVFSSASKSLFSLAGVNLGSGADPWLGSFCAIVGFLLAMKGPHVVKYSTYVMVPCLLGVGILLLVKIFSTVSIHDIMAMKPIAADTYVNTKTAFLCLIEGMFAFIFSWYPVLGSLSRITKTERSSYWGQCFGYIIALGFFVTIGIVSSTIMGSMGVYSTDPTDYLMTLDSKLWSGLSIGAIALANITTQTLGCYCLSLATKIFKPDWDYKYIAGGYTIFVVFLIFWQGIWTYYNIFLAATAIVAAPACSIILIDYFIIRRGKFSLNSVFFRKGDRSYQYTGGFNIVALIAFIAGVIAYLSVYNPISYVVKNSLLMKLTPTGVTIIVTCVTYYILCQVPALKKYVMRDVKNINSSAEV